MEESSSVEVTMYNTKLCGKAHLLKQFHGENMDALQQLMTDVCDNFTFISKLTIQHLSVPRYGDPIRIRTELMAWASTFRFILKQCVGLGGMKRVRNWRYVDILSDVESLFVDTAIALCNSGECIFRRKCNQIFQEKHYFDKSIRNMFEEVVNRTLSSPSSFMIRANSVLEYLDQILEDIDNSVDGYFLTTFFKFCKDWINHEKLQELLICVEAVLHHTAYHLYCLYCVPDTSSWRLEHIWISILKALILLPESSPPFTDELLMGYANCIQCILDDINRRSLFLWLPQNRPLRDQVKDINDKLGHLIRFCIDYTKHYDEQEKLSDMRINFQTLIKNMVSIIHSVLKREKKPNIGEEISLWLYHFRVKIIGALLLQLNSNPPLSAELVMEYVNSFRSIQQIMFSTIKDRRKGKMATEIGLLISDLHVEIHKDMPSQTDYELDPPLTGQLLRLSVGLLGNVLAWLLKDDDDDDVGGGGDLIGAVNHVLFVVRLLINYRNHYVECDKLSDIGVYIQRVTESIIYLSYNEEMEEKLAKCDMLMIILKALVVLLDSSPPLTGKHVKRSLDTIQQILSGLIWLCLWFNNLELIKLQILNNEVRRFVELLSKYSYVELVKLFDDGIQAIALNLGSLIYSSFDNETRVNMATETNHMLPNFVENVRLTKERFEKTINSMIFHRLGQTSPHTDLFGFFKFLLGNVKESIDCKSGSIMAWKDQFQTIHDDLEICSSFVQKVIPSISTDDAAQALSKRIRNAAYKAEYLIHSSIIGACPSTFISDLTEEIKLIKATVLDKKDASCEASAPKTDPSDDLIDVPSPTTDPSKDHTQTVDVVVGFKEEIMLIMERLTSNKKDLDVVSVTGMPGIGKTTLANKVYQHPFNVSHFDCRAWCCVSQDYNKKELLLTILGSIVQLTDEICQKSSEHLSVMVHKELTGRRYLIVMDDIWGMDVLDDLKRFFPNNCNGSRLIFTSRDKSIGHWSTNHIELRLLDEEESWTLLEQKVYQKGKCPSELCQVGKEIAQKCRGLPLAIVVVAGILSMSDEKLELQKQVAGNLHTALESQQHNGIDALNLSYKFLPDHLKPLFLYLGIFPGDKEIPMDQLIWLCSAEGFGGSNGSRSLEDQLNDLTDRNLLIVAERRYGGRVKTFRMHDLLRELSLRKAEEEMFMQPIHVHGNLLPDLIYSRYRVSISLTTKDTPTPSTANEYPTESIITHEHLQKFSMDPPLRSLLQFDRNKNLSFCEEAAKSVVRNFKLLRVLHFESPVKYDSFLIDALWLGQLKYISIQISKTEIPSSVSKLRNLETLIVKGLRVGTEVPDAIWKMETLRHLHINRRAHFSVRLENSSKLKNLETLSTPRVYHGEERKLFWRSPNLRKLRCVFVKEPYSRISNCQFPQLKSLAQLESLKLKSGGKVPYSGQFNLPSTLKKLTLLEFGLRWNEISCIYNLPNLEVLKLRSGAVDDISWEIGEDDQFPQLKFLKLEKLNLKKWVVSDDTFPFLQKLVIERCMELEEIPSNLGDIPTLETVEVLWGSRSASTSAMQIQEEQRECGNESLNVRIYPPIQDL